MIKREVKIVMNGEVGITYLDEKKMEALQFKVNEMNAHSKKKGEPEDWDILSEIIYGALHDGLTRTCHEYEVSQAGEAARETR